MKAIGGGTNLAEQTIAFLMSLIKFAAESARTVLVYTLADAGDAFGKETEEIRQELAEARSVSARQEHVLTPTAENEISAIVGHRLFTSIDRSEAQEIAGEFTDYYTRMVTQGTDLPSRATRQEFRAEMVGDYPFHPELLTTLNRKTSTIPNFQKTRGVLRLLAQVIRNLWKEKPADCYLIAPYHLNLADDTIASDLTSRLDRPSFKQVIEADIASPRTGTLSHAQEVDRDWVDAGKPAYGQRLAKAVFLHSLVQTGQSGVDPADLRLAVLQPGDDPALIEKALQRLTDRCWFFDYDGHRYRFKTEPSLRKIVDDETGLVGKIKAKAELDERIKKVWKKGVFTPRYFPAEASEVDDDAQPPKLVIVHYDATSVKATEVVPPPELVLKLFEYKGSLEEYRTYKNNLVFLAADADQVARLVEVAQRYLAVQRIVTDPDRMGDFNKEQKDKLRKMAEAAELDLRVAITKTYRHLYYPSADAPKKSTGLAHHLLQADEQGEMEKDQSEVVLRILKMLEKVLTADDKPLNPQYLKAKAWPAGMPSLSTEELRRAFAQRLGPEDVAERRSAQADDPRRHQQRDMGLLSQRREDRLRHRFTGPAGRDQRGRPTLHVGRNAAAWDQDQGQCGRAADLSGLPRVPVRVRRGTERARRQAVEPCSCGRPARAEFPGHRRPVPRPEGQGAAAGGRSRRGTGKRRGQRRPIARAGHPADRQGSGIPGTTDRAGVQRRREVQSRLRRLMGTLQADQDAHRCPEPGSE